MTDVCVPPARQDQCTAQRSDGGTVDGENVDDRNVDETTTAERLRPTPPSPASPGQLAMLWCAVFIARWAFAADQSVYHLAPDEPATLGMARWLSGTADWTMFQAATWRPGLATLLAPIFWVTDQPDHVYRAALVVNAAIGAAGAVLLVRFVARLCRTGPLPSLLIACSIAVLPASLSASAYVWAEPLVTVTFLTGTWCVLRYWDDANLPTAAVATAAASVGMVCHGRMMPFVVLVAAALVAGAVRHRCRAHVWIILLATVIAALVSSAYTNFVIAHVWTNPAETNTARSTLARLGRPLGVLDAAAGQIWYQLAASVGVVGFGFFVLVRRAGSRSDDSRDARLLLFLTLPLIAVSMLFMADRPRVDHLVYGRYNDAIVWPVLAVGIAWLFRGARTESRRTVWWLTIVIVAVTIELGLLIEQLHSRQLENGRPEFAMISGIRSFASSSDQLSVLRVTALAAAATVVAVLAVRWRGGTPGVSVALFVVLLVAGAVTTRELGPRLNSGAGARAVLEIEDGRVPADEVMGARFTPDILGPNVAPWDQLNLVLLFQWYLGERTFIEDFGNDDDVGPYVFAPSNDALMQLSGGSIVWDDPGSDMALWIEPSGG